MKNISLMFFLMPLFASAQQAVVKADDWAVANSKCAAFYQVVQSIVKPEARAEYERKSEFHLRYAKGLHGASEAQSKRLKNDVEQQTTELGAATNEEAKRAYFRNGMLGCMSVASTTPLVIKEHNLSMKEN